MPTSTAPPRIPAATLSAVLAWAVACGGSNPAQTPEPASEEATPTKMKSEAPAPAETAPTKDPSTEDPKDDASPALVGQAAPPIRLEGTDGPFDLEKAHAEGPVLAVFYRGDW